MGNPNEEDKKNITKSAHLHFQAGRWDEAVGEYEKLLKLDPEDINAQNLLGDIYVKKNDPTKAYEKYILVAEDLTNRGQADKAALMHKKIVQLNRSQLSLEAQQKQTLIQLVVKADEALADNEMEQAVAAFNEILKLDPEDLPAASKLAELDEKLGRIPAAVERYSQLGETFFKSRLFKKAQEMFKKVLIIDPENISARSFLAQIYVKQGSENEAKKEYLNAAEQALDKNDLDSAYEYAKLAVDLKSIEAHYIVGVVLFERQKWDEAKSEFDQLLRFKPNHLAALVYCGKIFDAVNQHDKAADFFQKALKIEGDNRFALESWADYCVKRKNKNEAVQTLTLLVDQAVAENQMERAVKWAKTLVSTDEALLPSKLKLAETLEKNKDRQEAAEIYYQLASAHGKQNKGEEADRYFQKTMELNPAQAGTLATSPVKAAATPLIPEVPLESPAKAKPAPVEPPKLIVPAVSQQEAMKAQLDVADQYVKQGLLDEAIDIYQQLIEANPGHGEIKEKLNKVYAAYAKTGTDLTEVLKTGVMPEEAPAARDSSPKIIPNKPETAPQFHAMTEMKKPSVTSQPNQLELETKAREEADQKARVELEKRAREEADKKAREVMEHKIHEETEKKIREHEEKTVREEMEKKIREDVEKRVRAEVERRIKEEDETKAREDAEKKAKEEAEKKAREEGEKKSREEAERKAKEEESKKSINEIQAKIRETVEKKTREHEEKKSREEADARERLEMERKVRVEVEQKIKDAIEIKNREESEKRIRESVEKEVRAAAEAKVREEIERRIREEMEKQDQEEEKKRVRDETKKKIHDTMVKKNEETALAEGDQMEAQERYAEALRQYQKVLETTPHHLEALQKVSRVQEILKSKEVPMPKAPPTLMVIDSSAKQAESPAKQGESPKATEPLVQPKPALEPEKDIQAKRKNNKIGFV